MSYFELGGVEIPEQCFVDFSQKYEALEASSMHIMSDGSAIKQVAWSGKLLVSTSGQGWEPLGLTALNYDIPLLMKCAVPYAIDGVTNIITLPAERRTDAGFLPQGVAIVNNNLVPTSINIVGDLATMGVLSGATAYRVHYFPEFNVIINKKPAQNYNDSSGIYSWSFNARQQ